MSDIFYHHSMQTAVEIERARRIRISLWAYAYEIENRPIVSDAEFDKECYSVNRSIKTGKPLLDEFFCTGGGFDPYTGMWIYKHPEFDKLGQLYRRIREVLY